MSYIGREIEAGLAVEGVRNTSQAVAGKWAKHVSADVVSRVQKVVDDSVRGRLEDSEGSRVVRQWFDGDLSGVAHADLLGYLLYQIYGGVISTPVNDATSHVFSVLQSIEHPTLTVFRKDSDVIQKVYGGGVINTLEISASTEELVRFSANIICANEASNSDTPSYDEEFDFIGKDITVKIADDEAGLSGASALVLKTVGIKYDLGAISDFRLGSLNPAAVYNAKMAIEIDFTKNMVDTTFEDLFKSGAYKYMQITIEGDADIDEDGDKPKIEWVFNKVNVQEWDRSGAADAVVEETVKLKAFLNNADSKQSEVTLVNLTSAYEILGS